MTSKRLALLIFSILSLTSTLSFASKTCDVVADGVYIPKGSFVDLDTTEPHLYFFYAYQKPDGTQGYVPIFLSSEEYLSSWAVPKKTSNCVEIVAKSLGFKYSYVCKKVLQYEEVSGGVFYDETLHKGHYDQVGITPLGVQSSLEFDFENCHDEI